MNHEKQIRVPGLQLSWISTCCSYSPTLFW